MSHVSVIRKYPGVVIQHHMGVPLRFVTNNRQFVLQHFLNLLYLMYMLVFVIVICTSI